VQFQRQFTSQRRQGLQTGHGSQNPGLQVRRRSFLGQAQRRAYPAQPGNQTGAPGTFAQVRVKVAGLGFPKLPVHVRL
jgi:hypothetical protein